MFHIYYNFKKEIQLFDEFKFAIIRIKLRICDYY